MNFSSLREHEIINFLAVPLFVYQDMCDSNFNKLDSKDVLDKINMSGFFQLSVLSKDRMMFLKTGHITLLTVDFNSRRNDCQIACSIGPC